MRYGMGSSGTWRGHLFHAHVERERDPDGKKRARVFTVFDVTRHCGGALFQPGDEVPYRALEVYRRRGP